LEQVALVVILVVLHHLELLFLLLVVPLDQMVLVAQVALHLELTY
jgi:hypothetical protein